MTNINNNTRQIPIIPAFKPEESASAPNLAPTFSIFRIFKLNGKEPARIKEAVFSASSGVKCPVIIAFPSVISAFTIGALTISSSKIIAIGFPILFLVASAKSCLPSAVNSKDT